jgi:hypothetical protein
MKKLIRWNDFRLNEGVILPQGFSEVRNIIEAGWDSIQELNSALVPHRVQFMSIEEFRKSLHAAEEKKWVPNFPMFAAYHIYLKMMVIVYGVSSEEMINGLKNPRIVNNVIRMLDHESVHDVQDRVSGGRAYSLSRSPSKDSNEYFSHYSETMAYARTLVQDLRNMGLEDYDILEKMRIGEIDHWIYKIYMGLDDKTQKLFKKMVYNYLNK